MTILLFLNSFKQHYVNYLEGIPIQILITWTLQFLISFQKVVKKKVISPNGLSKKVKLLGVSEYIYLM